MAILSALVSPLVVTSLLVMGVALNAEPIPVPKPQAHEKIVQCWPSTFLFTTLRDKYGETPIFTAANNPEHGGVTSIVLLVNAEAHTWSLVEFDTKVACMIGIGKDYKITIPGTVI